MRALLCLALCACTVEGVMPDAPPDAMTCESVIVVLFVHEFVSGVEVGCDPELAGNATPYSTGVAEPMRHIDCYDPMNDAGPGIGGGTVFTLTTPDAFPVTIRFDGYPGFSTVLFSPDDASCTAVGRSVSVFR